MDIENLVTEKIRAFAGIKSALPYGALANIDAEDILNFVTNKGKLRKIWGVSEYYNSGLGAGEIRWLEYFRNRWIFQQGNTVAREQTEGQANFAPIGNMILGSTNRTNSEKWENRIYLINGVENRYLEEPGSVVYSISDNFLPLGITPPGNGAKNWNGAGSFQPAITTSKVSYPGSTLADATYGYVVTWWDANRQVESLPNGSQVGEDGLWASFATSFANFNASAFTGMANNAVRVDVSALKAFGYEAGRVTHFIVYRGTQASFTSLDGGNTLRFTDFKRVADPTDSNQEAELRISKDYYDDRTVEADLGAVLDESLSPPPSGLYYNGTGNKATDQGAYGPRFVKFFRDQLWLFGARLPGTDNGTELQPDAVSARQVNYAQQSGIAYASDVNNHDYWLYSYNIGRSTGQRDTGIAKHRNTLIFFKEASSYYLDGSNPDNYEIRELDVKRGILVPGSLKETTLGPIGLGVEGFTLFDSVSGGKIISEEIADLVSQINLDLADKITSHFDPVEEKYECHCPIDDRAWNTRVFSYDCKLQAWSVTTRAGGAVASGVSSSSRTLTLIGDPRNGRLYDASSYARTTFNGQTMHAKWRSKALDFGAPEKLKSLQRVTITARGLWDFRLSIDVIPDFGENDSVSINDIDPDVRSDNWAADSDDSEGMKWDRGQWSKGSRKKKFTILVQCIAKNFNLVVRNSDTDADKANFEIEEILLEASLLGGEDDH